MIIFHVALKISQSSGTMRYLSKIIDEFSLKKFVFLAGPRQVGKTTLAKSWLGASGHYLNWDLAMDRAKIQTKSFTSSLPQGNYVFDEIHKYPRWKNFIKGLYDERHDDICAIVTGSARLDIYQRGGDSLLGRYELLHLHPFSIGELTHGSVPGPPDDWYTLGRDGSENIDIWQQLERLSGFPEPYHANNTLLYNRWALRRRDLLISEDIRDLTQIRNLALLENMARILPARVGSPFSLNNLRQDLEVAHDTAKNWLAALTRLYYCFVISPLTTKLGRSLSKEPKIYMWDWAAVEDRAARFENMVASHLHKAVDAWRDAGYGDYELFYWRDQQKREIDFVLTLKRRPLALIECKLSDGAVSPNFDTAETLLQAQLPRIQVVAEAGIDRQVKRTRVVSAAKLLGALV